MRADVTLGEVKARCAELSAKYGDNCCNHCEMDGFGCCDTPELWDLEGEAKAPVPCGGPNYEELCKALAKEKDDTLHALLKANVEIDHLRDENQKYKLVVATVQAMIGREIKM